MRGSAQSSRRLVTCVAAGVYDGSLPRFLFYRLPRLADSPDLLHPDSAECPEEVRARLADHGSRPDLASPRAAGAPCDRFFHRARHGQVTAKRVARRGIKVTDPMPGQAVGLSFAPAAALFPFLVYWPLSAPWFCGWFIGSRWPPTPVFWTPSSLRWPCQRWPDLTFSVSPVVRPRTVTCVVRFADLPLDRYNFRIVRHGASSKFKSSSFCLGVNEQRIYA
jgi:hypothetical protein